MAGSVDSSIASVVFSEKLDGSWQALHEPSGRVTHGLTKNEAEVAMKEALGMNESGEFSEPLTSDLFEGVAKDIALYLEGPVSTMLAFHSGFARLESYQNGSASIRLGGGCQGCPSSRLTLMNGVYKELQEKFGEDIVRDVLPVLD
ncbi:MAG: NifU family protein [Pseudobacteriovorax sp.]|nr:NifU family protein [Pseudobacteriovorax sp.]